MNYGQTTGFKYQLYAVAFKRGKGSLEFKTPTQLDLEGLNKAAIYFQSQVQHFQDTVILPDVTIYPGFNTDQLLRYGMDTWDKLFNQRQLLTLVTYVEIINEAKALSQSEYEPEQVEALATYLTLVLDKCVDKNARLCTWHSGRSHSQRVSTQHALNLIWNYPEIDGASELWNLCADAVVSDYKNLCALFGTKPGSTGIPGLKKYNQKFLQLNQNQPIT